MQQIVLVETHQRPLNEFWFVIDFLEVFSNVFSNESSVEF